MNVERRKNRRFQVKDKCFAVINPDPVKLVPIIDISRGGLGFYLDDHDNWPNDVSKLEIMVADCSFYLEKLPFSVVCNPKAIPNRSTSFLDGRRYGLKFGHLQPNQKTRLNYFIRNYTEGGYLRHAQQKITQLLNSIRAPEAPGDSCRPGMWRGFHRSVS